MEKGWEETVYRDGGINNLALIDIDGGVIIAQEEDSYSSTLEYDHEILLDQLDAAFSDEHIKGVIIRVNSPGGGVADCDEIFQKIRQLKMNTKTRCYLHERCGGIGSLSDLHRS